MVTTLKIFLLIKIIINTNMELGVKQCFNVSFFCCTESKTKKYKQKLLSPFIIITIVSHWVIIYQFFRNNICTFLDYWVIEFLKNLCQVTKKARPTAVIWLVFIISNCFSKIFLWRGAQCAGVGKKRKEETPTSYVATANRYIIIELVFYDLIFFIFPPGWIYTFLLLA